MMPHHTAVNIAPRYNPERDKRATDPLRILRVHLRELYARLSVWEISEKPYAAEQLHHWRNVLADVERQIAPLPRRIRRLAGAGAVGDLIRTDRPARPAGLGRIGVVKGDRPDRPGPEGEPDGAEQAAAGAELGDGLGEGVEAVGVHRCLLRETRMTAYLIG
jgi:hypothetical protein